MSAEFPLIIIIFDYLLGMIMWTLVRQVRAVNLHA